MCLTTVLLVLHIVQISFEISILILEEFIKLLIRTEASIVDTFEINIIIFLFQLFALHNAFVHATGIYLLRGVKLPYDQFKMFSMRIWICFAVGTCIVHSVKVVFSLRLVTEMENRLAATLTNGIKRYNIDMYWNVMWNYVQYFHSCCGVTGYKDWENIIWLNNDDKQYFLR